MVVNTIPTVDILAGSILSDNLPAKGDTYDHHD